VFIYGAHAPSLRRLKVSQILGLNIACSKTRVDKSINSWQGWADDLRTITEDIEVDVQAVRQVIDEETGESS
jgi:hypothetical protein